VSLDADRVYTAALRLLARRELSESQIRARLARRQFADDDIGAAIARLQRERALDDHRTALACARTQVRLKHRGRARVVREIQALGISRSTAGRAVAEVFADLDEPALLERALDQRLRRGVSLDDPAIHRRLHRYLVGQGFDPGDVSGLLHARARHRDTSE